MVFKFFINFIVTLNRLASAAKLSFPKSSFQKVTVPMVFGPEGSKITESDNKSKEIGVSKKLENHCSTSVDHESTTSDAIKLQCEKAQSS